MEARKLIKPTDIPVHEDSHLYCFTNTYEGWEACVLIAYLQHREDESPEGFDPWSPFMREDFDRWRLSRKKDSLPTFFFLMNDYLLKEDENEVISISNAFIAKAFADTQKTLSSPSDPPPKVWL